MHKAKVKCSVANDDDSDDASEEERRPKRPRTSQSSSSKKVAVGGSSSKKKPLVEKSPPRKAKKEKEFAWMDSDDDDDKEESDEDAKQDKQDTDEDEVTLEKLNQVERFGQMIILQDSLHQKLKSSSLGPEEIAAACRALARSKFFDGDLLDELCISLQKMINEDKLTDVQTTDAIVCLKELNYYKKDVFSAVAKNFKPKIRMLSPVARSTWLEAMQSLNHKADRDFLQVLEVVPLLPVNPGYRKVKCAFFAKGHCELGESCTFAHNEFAPVTLDGMAGEDAWRRRSVIMTHEQKYVFKEKEFGQSFQQTRGESSAAMGSMGSLPANPLAAMQTMLNAFQAQRGQG